MGAAGRLVRSALMAASATCSQGPGDGGVEVGVT